MVVVVVLLLIIIIKEKWKVCYKGKRGLVENWEGKVGGYQNKKDRRGRKWGGGGGGEYE